MLIIMIVVSLLSSISVVDELNPVVHLLTSVTWLNKHNNFLKWDMLMGNLKKLRKN